VAGYLANKIGRKWTLLSSSLFSVTSWILLATTTTVIQIYVAKVLHGICIGFTLSVQAMYVGEIATDNRRGALGEI
jgi:MFS family permease